MISLIAAVARNRALGKDGQLLWHLPEDMRYFRETTRGKPVIMGRKTWESLPDAFRPLPGRHNVVVTRQAGWQPEPASDQVSVASTIEGALDAARALGKPVWVMGGAQIYAQALPLADEVWVTEIAQDFAGDAYAPVLGPEWQEASREAHTSSNGLPFSFVCYRRTAL